MADEYGRTDWRDRDARDRELERREREDRRARADDPLEDYGQADFGRDYAYDPATRSGYRVDPRDVDPRDDVRRYEDEDRYAAERRAEDRYERDTGRAPEERRSWFGGRTDHRSNDRVLWVVATEALHRARGLDERDIHVHVENGVVILEGSVRNRDEKRRAEAVVDQRGVRDVDNRLRIRERSRWGF